ncbi:MAG: porin [Planctomycetaceae bacterium]|nr:porin [Planctomycetaceae bacterium]
MFECRFTGRCVRFVKPLAAWTILSWLGIAGLTSQSMGQDPQSLFGNPVESPVAYPVLAPVSENAEDSIEARFRQMQLELDELRASLNDTRQLALPKAAVPAPTVYPTTKVTGFFQADAGWFHQDANSLAMPQIGDVQDDRGFRRARLAATGKVADNVSYMLEMDFAFNGRPSFMDVWMDISSVPLFGNVRIGQWRQPFGLDELTSVKELTFLERPLMFGMAPFRQTGIGFHDTSSDQNITWAGSAFGTNTDPWGNSVGDRGYGGAARVTAVLLEDSSQDFLIHGGLDYAWLATPNSQIQYRNVPEYGGPLAVPGSVPFFVDTGMLAAENANLFNAELAATSGSWHAQSELRYSIVNTNGSGSAVFPAFYAQTGYVLTREHRPYNKAAGTLARIKPNHPVGAKCGGGVGAWELAFRYSMLDLNDGAINGGEITNLTYGVNWYLNNFTKLQFNYIDSHLNRAPIGDSHTDIFAVRAQLDF